MNDKEQSREGQVEEIAATLEEEAELESDEDFPESNEERIYEVGYLIVPTVAEEEVGSHITRIKDIVEGKGGSVISEEWPKMRKLSYMMTQRIETDRKDFKEAYFGWIKFETTPENMQVLDKELSKNTDFLRHIIIKTVREDTMYKEDTRPKKARKSTKRKGEKKEEVDEEKLDKAIGELVAE